MASVILKVAHAIFALAALGAGVWTVTDIMVNKIFYKMAILFLRCTLLACVTGILLSLRHINATSLAAISAVYVSGVAILALRKSRPGRIWALLFALSTLFLLCIDLSVLLAHVFEMLLPVHLRAPYFVIESMIILIFLGLKLRTFRTYRASRVDPTV